MEEKNSSELKKIISEIEKDFILLPSFQREFTWKDEDMQKGLVCSVLARMPIGSILLLKSNERDFGCKKIGQKTPISKNDDKSTVEYLLDGQQRLTVLSNVFSNVIFDTLPNYNYLIHDALKRRFFLRIPKWKSLIEKESYSDLFGLKCLNFPIVNPDIDFPSFLTGDIEPFIVCKSFLAHDDKFYNPEKEINNDLKNACLSDNSGYLIPLYLLAPTERKLNSSTMYFKRIIEEIGKNLAAEIKDYYLTLDSEKAIEFISHIIDRPRDEIDSQLEEKAAYWSDKMLSYLNACVNKVCLHQIILDGEDRSRAIDIYENLNKGGISLSTFDLIVAKVAKADPENNFYDRIRNYIFDDENRNYDFNVIRDDIKNYVPTTYVNASKTIQACRENGNKDISVSFTDPFLNILGITKKCIQEDFSDIKIDFTKRDELLKIDADYINKKCEIICTALDRAYFFFQTRCGIRKIGEINYQWMITIVALIFLENKNFFDKKVHDKLEAWYWTCLFTGEFNSDQNEKAIKNIKNLFSFIKGERDSSWLEINKIFDTDNFSKKDFILMENAKYGSYPKVAFRNFVCQFYLSKSYIDLINDTKLTVFYENANSLEAHHLLPVAQYKNYKQNSDEIRSDDKHLCNSPINFVYITPETNKDIGKEDLYSYQTKIKEEARNALGIPMILNDEQSKNMIDDNNDLNSRLNIAKNVLDQRFSLTKGAVLSHVKQLLGL